MSDTPRTDAIENEASFEELADFARQLERELRKLAAEYADLKVYGRMPSAAASASELEQEVLTLREYATVVTKENERLMGEVSNRERELAVVMAERDALRSRSATASVVTDAMVDRFLSWTLPKDFSPDCGISFDGRKPDQWNPSKGWPIGTNLLTDTQARAMLEHILGKS